MAKTVSLEPHSDLQPDRASISPVLDLTYLGTGSFQHVFTKTDAPDDVWVYKVPAAFGYIVPYTPPRSLLTPHSLYEHALKLALIRLPDAIVRRVSRGVAIDPNAKGVGATRSPLALLQRFCEAGQAMGRQLVAAYARPRRRQKFEGMLRLLQYIVQRGLADIPLPFRIVNLGKAVLRVNGEAQPYQGPILVQRRATCLFESKDGFRSIDWSDVVASLERLWRVGVGLSDMFKPWSVLDGRARLFDTSGLTRDLEKVQRHMGEEHLERREQIHLREWAQVSGDSSAGEYCRFLRAKLTQERLRRLWRADLPSGLVDRPKVGETGEKTGV